VSFATWSSLPLLRGGFFAFHLPHLKHQVAQETLTQFGNAAEGSRECFFIRQRLEIPELSMLFEVYFFRVDGAREK
jgi:hypothetical protein